MAIKCPKCGSEHTQSIRTVVQAGTTFSNGSVSGIGLGTDGAGVFAGTTSSTSQTMLAARFGQPKKPKKLEIIMGGVFSLATSPWLFSKQALMIIPLGMMAWWAWEIHAYKKRYKQYVRDYAVWNANNHGGYLCHTCGTSFIA